MLIVFFEDLLDQPEEFTREIAEFLGVDAEGFGDVSSIHANRSVGSARPHHKTIHPNLSYEAFASSLRPCGGGSRTTRSGAFRLSPVCRSPTSG